MNNILTTVSGFLEQIFGYYIIQLGNPDNLDLLNASPINNKIHLIPENTPRRGDWRVALNSPDVALIQSDFEALPFSPDSIDVIVMPHILESASHPQTILQETYQILIPEGHLIIIGINPFSLSGLVHWFKRGKNKLISMLRMRKWLLQLGFSVTDYKLLTQPLLKSKSWKKLWFGGDIYILVAKKSIISVTPLAAKTTPQKKTITAIVSPCIKPTNRV